MEIVEGEFCFPDLSEEKDDMACFELSGCDSTLLRGVAGVNERVVDTGEVLNVFKAGVELE